MIDTTTTTAEITAFAAAVRAHLDDLPEDDIADLTEGLEADLLEQAQDGDARQSLDDPRGYADELRASAGLPAHGSGTAPRSEPPLWRSAVARAKSRLDAIRSTRIGSASVDILLAIRPAWWVFSGWVIYQFVAAIFTGTSQILPPHFGLFLVMLASIVLSVQWGRGRWLPNTFVRVVRRIVLVAILCATIPLLVWIANETSPQSGDYSFGEAQPAAVYGGSGLMLDGAPVTNIFGFDAQGEKVEGLRLFDQNGDPLVALGEGSVEERYSTLGSSGSWALVPFPSSTAGRGWNVFPLQEVRIREDGTVGSTRRDSPFPFERIAALPGHATSTSTPTPTATPSAP